MYKRLIIIACLLGTVRIAAVVVGSDTVVSRQGFVVFPALDTNNEIRGFAMAQNGFRLENSSARCKYNAFTPCAGQIFLNGGLLWLAEDLVLQDYVDLPTVGAIGGNNYTLQFQTKNLVVLPSAGGSGCVVQSVGTNNMSSSVNTVDWMSSGNFVAAGASTTLRVLSFDGTTLTQRYSTSLATALNALSWRPGSSFLASGRASGSSELQLWYFDTSAYTLTQKDAKSFSNAVYAVAWRPDGNFLAVATNVGSTQDIYIYSFNATTSLLTQVTTYNAQSTSVSNRALSWDSTGSYLVVGLPSSATAQLQVLYFNGSTLTANAQVTGIGATVSAVSYCPTSSLIAVGLSTGSERLRLYTHNTGAGTLTEQTTARIGEASAVYSLDWNADGTKLLFGKASGTGTELRVYDVNKSLYTLYLSAQIESSNAVNSARWRPDGIYLGSNSTTANYFSVYKFSAQQLNSGFVFGNLKFSLGSDVLLNSTITFTGRCCIDGNGNNIILGANSGIIVDAGASLLLNNVTIDNVTGTNICCLDNVSTLSLNNVTLQLDGTWTFTRGYFDIIGDVRCTGTQVFVYRTPAVSTIYANAEWYFDSGMTFSYDPSNASPSRIAFQGSSSVVHFCDASMYVASCGLQLLKGTLMCEGACCFMNSALGQSGGITIGDGVSMTNNFTVAAMPKSGGIVMSGFLVNNNIN